MTFEQLHDLYFSQPEAVLDEQALRYFWNSAVAEEREACAKIADDYGRLGAYENRGVTIGVGASIATAIRARQP